ncbi:MAG: signal peptidase I [Patescibacteria group bacterium]
MWKETGIFFWELAKVFLISMAIIIPIRYFLVQPFFVRGASMEPNFLDGEYLVIDQLSYRLREPERGEVTVFRFPLKPSQFFIKRIVGLPGETVTVQDGRVIIKNQTHPNGVLLDESLYIDPAVRTGGNVTLTLRENEYFVLGDNRAASSDSRSWGVLPRDDLIGRAWIRAFPFTDVAVFSYKEPGFVSL